MGEAVTEDFKYDLDNCYFHPERDNCFLSEEEKRTARRALELLWNKEEIRIDDRAYSNEQIRDKLMNEFMPEMLDRALEMYRNASNVRFECPFLAHCIFRTILEYDAYIDRLFRMKGY